LSCRSNARNTGIVRIGIRRLGRHPCPRGCRAAGSHAEDSRCRPAGTSRGEVVAASNNFLNEISSRGVGYCVGGNAKPPPSIDVDQRLGSQQVHRDTADRTARGIENSPADLRFRANSNIAKIVPARMDVDRGNKHRIGFLAVVLVRIAIGAEGNHILSSRHAGQREPSACVRQYGMRHTLRE
jgi:hypothetical protein